MSEYPEGRIPIKWRDMPVADKPRGHPSTERLEIEKLQAERDEAQSAANWADMTKNRAIEETKQLRARVAELEAALEPLLLRLCEWAADNLTDENVRDWCGHVEPPLERARAAINPPQEPPEATTGPL